MTPKLILPTAGLFGSPYGIIAPLVPAIKSPNYEGLWVSLAGAKSASLELAGSMSTLSVQLYGTNDSNVANQNGYTITVGGTITNGDTIAATFANPNLPNSQPEVVTIPVVTADSTTTLAAKLAAAINADTKLAALAITATSAAAVVTVNFPSVAPGQNAGAAGGGVSNGNETQITTAITGGATESATVAVTSTGSTMGSALTALALTAIAAPLPAFIKARLTTLTGSGAIINGNLSAAF